LLCIATIKSHGHIESPDSLISLLFTFHFGSHRGSTGCHTCDGGGGGSGSVITGRNVVTVEIVVVTAATVVAIKFLWQAAKLPQHLL